MKGSETSTDIRKFLHTCKSCGQQYRLSIRADLYTIHRAECPYCAKVHFFDNRDGRLERLGRPDQAPVPAREPEPEPRATAEQSTMESVPPRSAQREEPTPSSEPAGIAESGGEIPVQGGPGSPPPMAMSAETRQARESKPGLRITEKPLGPEDERADAFADAKDNEAKRATRKKEEKKKRRSGGGLPWFRWYWSRDKSRAVYNSSGKIWVGPSVSASVDVGRLWKPALAVVLLGMVLGPPLILLSLNFPMLYLGNPDSYLARLKPVEPNRIMDRNGKVIGELFQNKTGNLKYDEIPKTLRDKLVFVEDQNFFSHGGVHWPSIFRAFLKNVVSAGYSQGGSTLTQQLARILLDDRSRRILRKLRETALAYHLESKLSKEEILTAYMNHVYLGRGANGMQTAARFYFNKQVKDLTFSEELALVSLPSAPRRYSPIRNPDRLFKKMSVVFDRMRDENFTTMTRVAFDGEANALFRGMNRSPEESIFGNRVNDAPFVSEYVRLQIARLLGKQFQFGAGLRVETTINGALQKAAQKRSIAHIKRVSTWIRPVRMRDGKIIHKSDLGESIAREYTHGALGAVLFGLPYPDRRTPDLQTASVGVNPGTGEILFLHGGTEFKSANQLNRAIHMRRQSGSSIKPIVYSAAIESGRLKASSLIEDTPIYVRRRKKQRGRPDYWLPGNITGVYEGKISVRRALAHSKNIPAIRVARLLGMSRLSEQFRKFFFVNSSVYNRRFRNDETVAIGSLEMSPLEMAVAFSAFGNNGIIRRPYLIRKIIAPDGKVLHDGTGKDEFGFRVPSRRRVLPGDAAHVMASLMRDSGRRGGVYRGGFRGAQFIGKTGTTNDFKDAWFVGVVPGLAAAVWIGYDDHRYSMWRGTGSGLAGPLWGSIVGSGYRARGSLRFSPRAVHVHVCRDSGMLPRAGCPEKVKELFMRKYVPRDQCELHGDSANPGGSPGKSVNSDSDFE